VVPDADEIAAAASNGAKKREAAAVGAGAAAAEQRSQAAEGSGKSSAVTPGSPSGMRRAAQNPADLIVFLCPNGHRLNGPKSLQGRAGQCPHCGEKFRIPSYDEPEEEQLELPPAEEEPAEEAPAEDEIPVGTAVENDAGQESEAVETFPEEVEIVEMVEELGPAATSVAPTVPPLPPGPSNQLFDVFSRLWPLLPDGTAVELVLTDGKSIRPTNYSPALSRQAFGVFAMPEESGTYRLLTIAWTSVARIEFANLKDLPPGVFS
jgi:hypothetical protein